MGKGRRTIPAVGVSSPRLGLPWWAWALMAGAAADDVPADFVDLAHAVGAPGLPEGTSAATCTYIEFQDWQYEGMMTVPRAELDAWLAELPGSPALAGSGCADAIACVQVDLTQAGDEVDARYLDVAVRSEKDGIAEVLMSAFTT